MCGLAGFVNPSFSPEIIPVIAKKMADKLKHRGPDDEGIYTEFPLGLAHRRLAILDLSMAGHQPMQSANKRYWMVYNGEVYNFLEIRQKLEREHGIFFRSRTDTEVVLEFLSIYKEDALKSFNGMFALALWDKSEKSLLLARDYPGIKPLYYTLTRDGIIFASTISALMAMPDFKPSLSVKGLKAFFTYGYIPAPHTALKNVYQLEPGKWLRWTLNSSTVQTGPFWDESELKISDELTPQKDNLEFLKLRDLLTDSVHRQLVSDVPIGVFLSGGIDSSILAAIASRYLGSERTHTFSLGFNITGKTYNELDDAQVTASALNTHHTVLRSSEDDMLNCLNDLVIHYDNPFGDQAAMPTMLLSKMTRQHGIKVCLSGEGGDELFGGYRRYISETVFNNAKLARMMQLLPVSLMEKILQKKDRLNTFFKYARCMDPVERHHINLAIMDEMLLKKLLRPEWAASSFDALEIYHQADPGTDKYPIARLCKIDQRCNLTAYLEKTDRASMSAGLEVRVPFLDHKIIHYANSLPDRYRINSMKKKWLLKQAFADYLPPSVLTKPKHGFSVPISIWFHGVLKEILIKTLDDPQSKLNQVLQTDIAKKMLTLHLANKKDTSRVLWLILLLGYWLERFNVSVDARGD